MGAFSARATGELDVASLPVDIADRLARRAEEGRLFGIGGPQGLRVQRDRSTDDAPGGYREAPTRDGARGTLRIVRESGPMLFDDVRLVFDGARVRWDAKLSRARTRGLLVGGFAGGLIGLMTAPLVFITPVFGAMMLALSAGLLLMFTLLVLVAAKQQLRIALEKMLREEAVEARNEARLRVELGGGVAQERARAVLSVLGARSVALTEDERARILAESDPATTDRWLARAATAGAVADVFEARVRVDDGAAAKPRATVEPEPQSDALEPADDFRNLPAKGNH